MKVKSAYFYNYFIDEKKKGDDAINILVCRGKSYHYDFIKRLRSYLTGKAPEKYKISSFGKHEDTHYGTTYSYKDEKFQTTTIVGNEASIIYEYIIKTAVTKKLNKDKKDKIYEKFFQGCTISPWVSILGGGNESNDETKFVENMQQTAAREFMEESGMVFFRQELESRSFTSEEFKTANETHKYFYEKATSDKAQQFYPQKGKKGGIYLFALKMEPGEIDTIKKHFDSISRQEGNDENIIEADASIDTWRDRQKKIILEKRSLFTMTLGEFKEYLSKKGELYQEDKKFMEQAAADASQFFTNLLHEKFSSYLMPDFDSKQCRKIKGNAIIFTNKNTAHFIIDDKISSLDIKDVNRQKIPFTEKFEKCTDLKSKEIINTIFLERFKKAFENDFNSRLLDYNKLKNEINAFENFVTPYKSWRSSIPAAMQEAIPGSKDLSPKDLKPVITMTTPDLSPPSKKPFVFNPGAKPFRPSYSTYSGQSIYGEAQKKKPSKEVKKSQPPNQNSQRWLKSKSTARKTEPPRTGPGTK